MKARLLALALLLLLPLSALCRYKPWYNLYNFSYGAKARSMGNAFTAVADDLTAAFWNPAGLAALTEAQFYMGYRATQQDYEFDLQAWETGSITRLYRFDFSSSVNQIDFFSLSAPARVFRRPWTFALGYYRYVPYGFRGSAQETVVSNRYPDQPLLTTVAFKGSEGVDILSFSAAAALSDHFSLGATLQQFFNTGSLLRETTGPADEFHSQFTEHIRDRNFILGVLFQPVDALRLGFTWHSGLQGAFVSTRLSWRVNEAGERYDLNEEDNEAAIEIPEQYSLGALLRPARWLDLSAEYSLLNWDKAYLDGYFQHETLLPFPQKADWPLGQKRSRNLRFGAEARVPLRTWQFRLRAGGSLETQLYADSRGGEVKIRGYAAGVGIAPNRNLLAEFTFQRQVGNWPEKGFYPGAPDVNSHFRGNVFFFALTYRFGHAFKE